MRLDEAIKRAGSQETIRRKSWKNDGISIKPTDSERCCEMYLFDKLLSDRWNPYREDLLATDWILN